MKSLYKIQFLLITLLFSSISCSTDGNNDIDEERPTITINYEGGFPQPCIELVRGDTYEFRAQAADNMALASYSLDIHHNFDHHTHDDQEGECSLDSVKEAANPMLYLENFSIEDGPAEYEIVIPIAIPDDADTGDYHTQFSVTDETGWQSRTAVDIKIIE